MKISHKILLGALTLTSMSLASCDDYLDINTNPNTPASEDALFYQRVPWMQFYMEHGYHIAASNSTFYTGNFYRTNAREGAAAIWNLNGSTRANNAQQWFYTMVGNNLSVLYTQAMEAQAYHYAGVAKFFRAYGFMMLHDIFGEVPYSDAFTTSTSPKYDTGRDIFMGCISDIEEAIELLGRTQGPDAPALSLGDSWNGGDASKWQKMCYLLKARWLNHLSKKAAGSYKEGKYDAAEILACLDKAHMNNEDNTVIRHEDKNTPSHDQLGWNEPVDYNALFSCIGMNSNIYVSKTWVDNLTNFDGKGLDDPRAAQYIPWTRSRKSADSPEYLTWSEDGLWRRSMGVDLVNEFVSTSIPASSSFDTKTLSWSNSNPSRANDTIYVWTTCGSTGYSGTKDILYRRNKSYDESAMTGIFFVRAESPSVMAGYPEACFIRAEVKMRQGNTAEAYQAMRNGVKASCEFVRTFTDKWAASDPSLADVPAFRHVDDDEITAYLDGALGTEADVSMAKILTQKLLAMPMTGENWNDMRRFDYSPDVFMNYNIAKAYYDTPTYERYCNAAAGEKPRRWKQSSYELNYNTGSLEAIGQQVPGALELPSDGGQWYNSDKICTLPIWWDSTQE